MFDKVVAYKNQDYSALKKAAISSGTLFRDPEFPPTEQSLFYTPGKANGIVWKRPKDICGEPRLYIGDVRSNAMIQGDLGNCWFVAACCCLSVRRSLWSRIIVDHGEQDWDSLHAGIFHFRFWRFGVWTDVVIDDFLPTRDGKLVFCHSPYNCEFWPALLEKAYAKLYGCYEAMDGGELAEALEDFTGGVAENFDLSEDNYLTNSDRREDLFLWLSRLLDSGSLICAAIPARSHEEMEQTNEFGLTKGHAYAVTAIRSVHFADGGGLFDRDRLEMIRLRNPWGPGSEWKGPFSDGSPEWNRILKSDRQKIGLTFENDGEFWMTFYDFCKYFFQLAVCHRVNTSRTSFDKRWTETVYNGEWILPHRVGGCINNRATFLNNPQFLIDVPETDEVMIQLIQKMTRTYGRDRETVGFTIMKVDENRSYRVHVIMPIVTSSAFRNSRSVFVRRSFKPGRYVVVASTFDPGVLGSFLLRVYTGGSISVRELVLERPVDDNRSCLPYRPPVCVTQIRVIGADGLQRSYPTDDIEAYCIISCEGQKVRSPTSKKGSNPEWNTYAVFYRKEPLQRPVRVDVYNKNAVGPDEYLGGNSYIASRDVKDQPVDLPLVENDDVTMQKARLRVVITTSRNLQAV